MSIGAFIVLLIVICLLVPELLVISLLFVGVLGYGVLEFILRLFGKSFEGESPASKKLKEKFQKENQDEN
jgi:hypothetical protein